MKHSSAMLAARDRILGALQDELKRGDVSSRELLAIMAHATGACIAFQDQRAMTPEAAMRIVGANLEIGNREAMADVLAAGGRAN